MNNDSLLGRIWEGINDTCYIWRKEMRSVISDEGVLIFCVLVPLLYPLLYAWIYTNEIQENNPVIIIDQSRTHLSCEFIRMLDATQEVRVAGYAGSLEEAKHLMGLQEAGGAIYIPQNFDKKIARGEQATLSVFAEMNYFLNYKGIYRAASNVSSVMNAEIQKPRSGGTTNRDEEVSTEPMKIDAVPIFNPTEGYGNAIIPAVLILIIQQTLFLGIGLAAGTARESNRYGELVPVSHHYNGIFRIVFGKASAFFMLYAALAAYVVLCVPRFFHFTAIPQGWDLLRFMVPYLLSVIFCGMALSCMVRYRENVILFVVFTSVPFLFLTGVSWPLSDMPRFWQSFACLFPSTFGVRGFLRLSSMGGTLADVQQEFHALWLQVFFYFILACAVYRYQINLAHRHVLEHTEKIRGKIKAQREKAAEK